MSETIAGGINVITNNDGMIPLEYGDLELPAFSGDEEVVRGMELDFKEILAMDEVECLDNDQGVKALKAVDELVADYIVSKLDEVAINGEFKVRAENVVRRKDWAGVEDGSGEKFVLRELVMKANRIKFMLVNYWLYINVNPGINAVAELEYTRLMPAMAAMDKIFIKMSTEKFPIDSNERVKRGLKNECAVVREVNGEVVEVPFHEAYKEETAEIVNCYVELVETLVQLRERAQEEGNTDLADLCNRKMQYYILVAKAFNASDPKVWNEADSLLPRQVVSGNDVIHIHPIEIGYMEDRILRAPEISLRAPDTDEAEAQVLAQGTKDRMIKNMEIMAKDYPEISDILTKGIGLLQQSNASVRHFLGTGLEIDLKPAGQLLPNEIAQRIVGGIDSSLDVSTIHQRYVGMQKAFKEIFGVDPKELGYRFNAAEVAGKSVASHELGHAIGLTDGTDERLNDSVLMNPYIEEWKATVGGLLLNYYFSFKNGGEVTLDDLKQAVLEHILWAGRYFALSNHPHAAGYVRKSMMLMDVMQGVDILKKNDGNEENPWEIHLEERNIRQFFEFLEAQYIDILDIYESGDEEHLCAFLEGELMSTPFVEYACDNISVEGVDRSTIRDLPILPRDLKECDEAEKLVKEDTVDDGVSATREGVEGAVGK